MTSTPPSFSGLSIKKPQGIRLTGARQNNLKSIRVEIPTRALTVVTGVSGSGKSSLAFDTLYAEGQRRYIESLSTYTRQFLEKMPKPEYDTLENIPPSIALEQRNQIVNSRSTVGTQTEIVDYLRILFAKIGHTYCKECGKEVRKTSPEQLFAAASEWFRGRKGAITAPLPPPSEKTKAVAGVLKSYREQGFRRVLWQQTAKKHQVLDLDELGNADFPKIPLTALSKGQIYLIVDRLKLEGEGTAPVDPEMRTRMLDSIGQAILLGRDQIAYFDLDSFASKHFKTQFACVGCGTPARLPEPQMFSFNSPLGACERCSGFGFTLDLDETLIVPDPSKTLKNGAIDPFAKPSLEEWQSDMFRFCERHGISVGKRYRELTAAQRKLIWEGDPKDKTFPGIIACFEYMARKKYKLHVRVFIRRYQSQTLCPQCKGARLKPEALLVRIGKKHIGEVLALNIYDARDWFQSLDLPPFEAKIAEEVLSQVTKRLQFLDAVGVGYLTLNRLAKTLSGGEYQRINLATQLGNGLCGTLYVLDEPSIGLHAADTDRLIGVLQDLRNQGNTVVVVEHDLEVMKAADWLIELGPGAGRRGGELMAQGTSQSLQTQPGSLTGKYLSGDMSLLRTRPRRSLNRAKHLVITGCAENNLKSLTAEFPLERFVVVTGVSGSGKSTLVHKTLYQALQQIFSPLEVSGKNDPGAYDKLYGADHLRGVVLLDQKPIGKSSRSNPATYMKAWDEVRRIYANQVVALRRGYTPQHFSFNVDGGRCPVCKGEGEITLDMHFMAEVKVPCEECDGKRFKKNVLEITYRGKNIHQLLNTTIDESYDLFRDNPVLARKLGTLRDVGLGYLMLGQSATTLSGGESQRLKIASALDDRAGENLLYLFDEPTTGLHLEDIKKLLDVIQDLVSSRNSVIMIEHQLDVIAQADWVIDLGPGGGTAGGKIVATGSPDQLVKNPESITGQMLAKCGYEFPADEARESLLS